MGLGILDVVEVEDGLLRACAIRVTNRRRLRELAGHPAWAAVERIHWGSDPTFRQRYLDAELLLHPRMRALRSLAGLTVQTIDMLLAKKRASDRKAWLEAKGDLAEV